jgi:hypothetical protein
MYDRNPRRPGVTGDTNRTKAAKSMEVLRQISVVGVHWGPTGIIIGFATLWKVTGRSCRIWLATDWRGTSPNPSLRDEGQLPTLRVKTPGLTTEAFPTATQLP